MSQDLEQLKEQYRLLGEEIKKLEAEPKRWRAEKGSTYWFVDSTGGIYHETEMYDEFDDYHHQIGNHFQTKEEAEEWKEWHDTICELRAFSDGLDGEFGITHDGLNFISYNIVNAMKKYQVIRFATKRRADEAIEHFNCGYSAPSE